MKGNTIPNSTSKKSLVTNPNLTNRTSNNRPSTANLNKKPSQANPEEDYITNLQKTVYYLELEMKLMKDREIETKNKVGGYEILFRDGVPLNEHFLALKTKYTNERDHFDKLIEGLTTDIYNIENENKYLVSEVDHINKNYYDFAEKYAHDSDFYSSKIFEINAKVINETNTKDSHLRDKDFYSKQMYKFNSENVHHNRTLEKNKLFKENKDEKNKIMKEKNIEKFNEIDKLTVRSLLEQEQIFRKFENNSKQKQIENENSTMIFQINKLERDLHMAKAKISELENIQILNKKYLLDEELIKQIHEKENKKLNEDLDNLSKLNEENLKQRVRENEKNQSIIIRNSIANNELKMGLLLQKFKTEENIARELLEEKNAIAQKITQVYEVIENQKVKEIEVKHELIDVKNAINEYEALIAENTALLEVLTTENTRVKSSNEKYEVDIKNLTHKIEELQQKIELNAILKDVDINELKMLSQNNAIVNSSINNLMTKWDQVNLKLQEMENNK
jgi:hypothetical protein